MRAAGMRIMRAVVIWYSGLRVVDVWIIDNAVARSIGVNPSSSGFPAGIVTTRGREPRIVRILTKWKQLLLRPREFGI